MASKVAGKIQLQSVNELLGVPEIAGTMDIDVNRIHSFKDHPFKVVDDEKMDELVASIKENGVLSPVIVRPDQKGDYEMISGHRRLHAGLTAGLTKIPAIVKEMSDDEATILMVDANIQREELLPSERAYAFKMKMEALNRQGYRSDLDSSRPQVGMLSTDVGKSGGKEARQGQRTDVSSRREVGMLSADIVGKSGGIGARQVQRYIRLTYLTPELLELVDNKKLGVNLAVDISFFDESVQGWIYEYIKENGFIKPNQIEVLKKQINLDNMTQYVIVSLLNSVLPEKKSSAKVSLSEKKLDKYFPSHYSAKKREEVILSLLEKWKQEQET